MENSSQEIKRSRFRFPIWAKVLSVLFLSVSIVSIVAISFFSTSIKNTIRNFYIDESIKTADTLSLYLDVNNIKTIKNKVDTIYKSIPEEEKVENSYWDEPEWYAYLDKFAEVIEMQEYKDLMTQIEKFHAKNHAKYTYVAYADLENERLIYLVDDAPEEERCLPGSFDDFTDQDKAISQHMSEGFLPEITNMPEYGYLVSVGRPIYDGNEIIAFSMVELSMDEIIAKENQNTAVLTAILVSLSVASILGGFFLVALLIVRPVRRLTKVANEYTEGENAELNKFSQVNIRTKDEIEDLSNSMKKMEGDIKHYISDLLSTTTKLEGAEKKADELKTIADKDALTGVYNKRAYFETEDKLNKEIQETKGKTEFGITMIDLNDLKVTNDTYGHEKGDALLVSLVEIIKKVYINSTIYRIGGDEFVVISQGEDLKNINKLTQTFKDVSKDEVSAAIGVAMFDRKTDDNVEDTFKRADKRMYELKRQMKENG